LIETELFFHTVDQKQLKILHLQAKIGRSPETAFFIFVFSAALYRN